MQKLLMIFLMAMSIGSSYAVANPVTITIYSPYSAGHGGQSSMMRVLEEANRLQKKYHFVQENRPGAQGTIALKQTHYRPEETLAIMHATFVDSIEKGLIKQEDYIPVHAIGDACWAIGILDKNKISRISDLKNMSLIIGTVGSGNVTHLTGITISERQKLSQRLVLFKSNYDAVINLVGNHGVTFVIERPLVLKDMQSRQPNLNIVAVTCDERHPEIPEVLTLAEQGFILPSVFNIVVSNQNMSTERREQISQILDRATVLVGKQEIKRMSDFVSPVFAGKYTAQQFYDSRVKQIKILRDQYRIHLRLN